MNECRRWEKCLDNYNHKWYNLCVSEPKVRSQSRLPSRPCLCGRVVKVKYEIQRHGGGKARVKHKCPHGQPCIAGEGPGFGTGFNRNTTCRECVANEA